MSVIGIIIGTPILMLVAKWFKIENNIFLTALKINAIAAAIVFVFSFISISIGGLINIIAVILMIKKFYNIESWGRTIGVWIVWAIITAVIIIVIVMIAMFIGLLELATLLGGA